MCWHKAHQHLSTDKSIFLCLSSLTQSHFDIVALSDIAMPTKLYCNQKIKIMRILYITGHLIVCSFKDDVPVWSVIVFNLQYQ